MALGNPTIAQYKKSASAPFDILRFTFNADASYPAGGYTAFQTWVRLKLGRNVNIAGVYRCSPLKSANAATVDLLPTYDITADKLYFTLASTGVEITDVDLTAGTSVDLIILAY